MVTCQWIVFYVILGAEQNLSLWGQESISWSRFSSNQATLAEVLLFLTAKVLFGHGFEWDSVICGECGPFMSRVKWWGTGSSVFMFDRQLGVAGVSGVTQEVPDLDQRNGGSTTDVWRARLSSTGPDLLDRTSLDQRWCFVTYSSVDLPTLSASFLTNDTQVTRHGAF